MKVQVVKQDRVVVIDGEGLNFDFELDSNIWAIQWDGSAGEVEYNDATPNLAITDFSDYQYLVDAYILEGQRKIEEEELAESARISSMTYEDRRREEYPEMGDQLDSLFHAGVFPEDMRSLIQAVKDKHPKV
jgi:hypothetical protein